MKNIKVNINNYNGKRSSTTINANIATYYYKFCVPALDKEYIKTYDLKYRNNVAIAHRNKVIQDFVNKLINDVRSGETDHIGIDNIGIDKDFIELMLLNEIAFSKK